MQLCELPDVLTVQQLIDFLPLGRNSVYELLNSGKLAAIKVGRKYMIPKECLVDYLRRAAYNGTMHMARKPAKTMSLNEGGNQ